MKKNKKLPVWDLSDFYKSHESEKFQQDLQKIEKES